MSRIYQNFVSGTVADNPLTLGATTVSSDGLASLAAITTPATAMIVLDPQSVSGAPEIIIVTAHTASTTLATITRGALGTVARQHTSGTTWVHSALADDMISATLLAAKGTLLTASGAGVPVALAVGTDGQFLTADAASPGGLKYVTPAAQPSVLLESHDYNPSGAVARPFGATLVVVDSTNLLISFTVPASGRVIAVMNAECIAPTTSVVQWCLVEGVSTIVTGSDLQVEGNAGVSPSAHRMAYRALITGLTPGASKTWYWGAYGGNTGNLLIGGTSGSSPNGPALMEIWSA